MTSLPSSIGPMAAVTAALVAVVAVSSAAGVRGSDSPDPGRAVQGAVAGAVQPPDAAAAVAGMGERPGGIQLPRPAATSADGSPAAVTAARPRWRWPVQPRPPVLRPYRAPVTTYGAGHRGLDLGARRGEPVLSVEAGVVTHAARVAGRGTVTVTHADGLRSTYEPVSPTVSVGEQVLVGDVLGVLQPGRTHCGARMCMHLGARRGAGYLDPLPLLVSGTLALLPLRSSR